MLKLRELKESDRALMENFWNSLTADTFRWWHHYGSVDDIFHEKSHKLIGLQNGKIVVYGFLLPDDNFPGTPSLGIVTSEEERRKGLGTKMLKALEKVARKKGYKNIFLTAYIENKGAVRFYNKMGYEIRSVVKRRAGLAYSMKKKLK